jgi:GTP-binding protein YchF
LTEKPVLYVANVSEADMHTGNAYSATLQKMAKEEGAEVVVMCNNIEQQIAEMEDPDDKALFMEEYKMTEPALNKLIRATYALLELQTYFTAGVQEVRAWTIREGWKAPQAASVIHTDFEKGFIKAEVIAYQDFIHYGSESACRDSGKLRIEGKEYIVKDGDVMHFRFNV